MPAVFDALVQQRGLTAHKAWRIAYIVPFIIIVVVALGMLFTCDDTPTGKWSDRALHIVEGTRCIDLAEGNDEDQVLSEAILTSESKSNDAKYNEAKYKEANRTPKSSDLEIGFDSQSDMDDIKGEVIVAPSSKEVWYVVSNVSTLALSGQYACSFGAELALGGILGSYYAANFPHLGQTKCAQWAAMFGLLNVLFRPLGGYISDLIYRHTESVWAKKLWLVFLGVATGTFLVATGISNPKSEATMFGLFAGLAFFLEAANGASFSLVPHVYPAANGELYFETLFRESIADRSIQGLYQAQLAQQETWEESYLILSSGTMEYTMIDLSGLSELYVLRLIWWCRGFGLCLNRG